MCIRCIVKGSKTYNCKNVWWGSFHVQIDNNVNMQRWDPENHDSEERWSVSRLNQDESQEIWFNECLTIIRHFKNRERLVHFMTHTQQIIVAHSLWRKETRYCLNFITFCKKEQVYISRHWHSFFHCTFLLLQWAYQTFPESRDRVVFLYLIFLIYTDLFSTFFLF